LAGRRVVQQSPAVSLPANSFGGAIGRHILFACQNSLPAKTIGGNKLSMFIE
jgi:hypothetical protein